MRASCSRRATASRRRWVSTNRRGTSASRATRPTTLASSASVTRSGSGRRRFEELLPPLEQRSERIPRALVRGECLCIGPVGRELLLERLHLGFAHRDLRLDPLELGRPFRPRLLLSLALHLRLGRGDRRSEALFPSAQHLGPAALVLV